jgi:hypothetical protein
MLNRDFFNCSIDEFLALSKPDIVKSLLLHSDFATEKTQKTAWAEEVEILQKSLVGLNGHIYFEFSIPRMGRRIDVLLLINGVVFIIEFKVGEKTFTTSARDQTWDYALDLKNFHETSHHVLIVPILVATATTFGFTNISFSVAQDNVADPVYSDPVMLREVLESALRLNETHAISHSVWSGGRYSPTPTIIEAASALYNNHSVAEITRSDATAKNLKRTSQEVSNIITSARTEKHKIICFITGVPGAGKTLVGLDIASKHMKAEQSSTSVFLSGNGPLVAILREALTRDKVRNEKLCGNKITKGEVLTQVKSFIQNVHHFRDEYRKDLRAPFDHVAIFDEAQRAWNLTQTASFMKQKKGDPNFTQSEPEFLISCLDRHEDWCVIVCLVGGGQEINTGEAGISEWFSSLSRSFPQWQVFVSPKITSTEYDCAEALSTLNKTNSVTYSDNLHLAVSMRSFRAEHLSAFVKSLLDKDIPEARSKYQLIKHKFPIVLTRDVQKAKEWLKARARGTERYGIVVSSQAYRLKPLAMDVRSSIDPIHWFLDDKTDVRSSYYLEDVATEFHVQGLELDWTCVTWDGDFRSYETGWEYFSFVGSKWNRIRKAERKTYLKNAYRVLLTRARQGMVILVPSGKDSDHTRLPAFYDETFEYLQSLGLEEI